MSITGYPVEYNGLHLTMRPLTVALKDAFCAWLRPRALKLARETLEPLEYQSARQEILGGAVFWNATPSMYVGAALQTQEGQIQLNRLLLGLEPDKWSDAQVLDLMRAKDTPDSDYALALNMAWETSDPKAN